MWTMPIVVPVLPLAAKTKAKPMSGEEQNLSSCSSPLMGAPIAQLQQAPCSALFCAAIDLWHKPIRVDLEKLSWE